MLFTDLDEPPLHAPFQRALHAANIYEMTPIQQATWRPIVGVGGEQEQQQRHGGSGGGGLDVIGRSTTGTGKNLGVRLAILATIVVDD